MQPFSRETIIDRRQAYIRWSAVVAGALVALGTWLLLQLLFTGGSLSSIDPDEVDNLDAFGIGTGVGSVLAPLLAMFAGGLVAGRLASHFEPKVSAFHGVLVWTIASVVGIVLLGSAVGAIAPRQSMHGHMDMAPPPAGASAFVDDVVRDMNLKLSQQSAPTIDKDVFIDAARSSLDGRAAYDREAFVMRLDDKTSLSRPEAELALSSLGDRAGDAVTAGFQLARHREAVLSAADDAGNAMLAAGFVLLLCAFAAAGGALAGARLLRRYRQQGESRGTHTTAPYPVVAPESTDPDASAGFGR